MADKDEYSPVLDTDETVVIAESGTKSGSIDLMGMSLVGIYMPATFTGTSLTFEASADNSTFLPVENGSGSNISKTVSGGEYVALDPNDFIGIRYLKIVSGSSEGSERTITLALRQV